MNRATQLRDQREATDAAARAGFLAQPGTLSGNLAHRALFSLPPIRSSSETTIAVVELPPQKVITGDTEIDAVLWLREVIGTGQANLIAKAKVAAARIETPLKDLETRYRDHLVRANPGNWVAPMAAFGFADLDRLATNSMERAARRHEAKARFGDTIFSDTPAERFCIETLARLREDKKLMRLKPAQVDARFDARPDLRPSTLADCLHELHYWTELYWLRNAVAGSGGDSGLHVDARRDYVFRCMARIRPRNPDEAAAVLRHLFDEDCMQWSETKAILFNLIGADPAAAAKTEDA